MELKMLLVRHLNVTESEYPTSDAGSTTGRSLRRIWIFRSGRRNRAAVLCQCERHYPISHVMALTHTGVEGEVRESTKIEETVLILRYTITYFL